MRTQRTEYPTVGELYCAAQVVPGDTVSRPTSRFRGSSDFFWRRAFSRRPVDKTRSSSPKSGKSRQRDRSAGVLVAASACGIFLDAAELTKYASTSKLYFPLSDACKAYALRCEKSAPSCTTKRATWPLKCICRSLEMSIASCWAIKLMS